MSNITSDVIEENFAKSAFVPQNTSVEEEGRNLIKVLTDHESFLAILRSELRGEVLYHDEKTGEKYWVQIDKPMFVKLDDKNKPIKVINPKTGKYEFLCNDDGVNEVINTLKACGFNPVAPLTTIDENEIRGDLMEMESKVAAVLFLNRKKWGMTKSEYPMNVGKLKILIKDARYRSKDGTVLKALRTVTSRIEQAQDNKKQGLLGGKTPFS